jgi:hypothetical protein
MSGAKVGQEFVTHEFDEAIAIQAAIVAAERALGSSHPLPDARRAIKACAKEDRAALEELERLGREHGATGKAEDVAAAMKELMQATTASAGEAESEAYEAHAVLLTLKRKQQDSAAAILQIAREMEDADLRDAARRFERSQRNGADTLADELAAFAVSLATREPSAQA